MLQKRVYRNTFLSIEHMVFFFALTTHYGVEYQTVRDVTRVFFES